MHRNGMHIILTTFFRDGGEYLKYVSMEDKKTNSNMKTSNKTQISYSTTVRVLRSQLQQKTDRR